MFYLTFAQKDKLRRNGWITVDAESYESARNSVERNHGKDWAMLYEEDFRPQYFPDGELSSIRVLESDRCSLEVHKDSQGVTVWLFEKKRPVVNAIKLLQSLEAGIGAPPDPVPTDTPVFIFAFCNPGWEFDGGYGSRRMRGSCGSAWIAEAIFQYGISFDKVRGVMAALSHSPAPSAPLPPLPEGAYA